MIKKILKWLPIILLTISEVILFALGEVDIIKGKLDEGLMIGIASVLSSVQVVVHKLAPDAESLI